MTSHRYTPEEIGELNQIIDNLRAEVERLLEKVEILEAEIRVMRKLPAEIDRRMTALEPKPSCVAAPWKHKP